MIPLVRNRPHPSWGSHEVIESWHGRRLTVTVCPAGQPAAPVPGGTFTGRSALTWARARVAAFHLWSRLTGRSLSGVPAGR